MGGDRFNPDTVEQMTKDMKAVFGTYFLESESREDMEISEGGALLRKAFTKVRGGRAQGHGEGGQAGGGGRRGRAGAAQGASRGAQGRRGAGAEISGSIAARRGGGREISGAGVDGRVVCPRSTPSARPRSTSRRLSTLR